MPRKTPRFLEMARQALRRFADDTRGSLIILTLLLFVLMAFMGGLAVDMMRYEQTRTALQNTLDRATLAAAAMTQTQDPKAVVEDYFAKAGMSSYLETVTPTVGVNFRRVEASASAPIEAYFLHLIKDGDISGDPTAVTMLAAGTSTAEQRVSNVEISLVLDVSGSMASNERLVNLKIAAKKFVQTVLSNDTTSKISITIVPFNNQVNIGPDLRSQYPNLTNDRGYTNADCVILPETAFYSTGLDPKASMRLENLEDYENDSDYTMRYLDYADKTFAVGYDPIANPVHSKCPTIPNNILRLPSRSITDLQNQIENLFAIGGTAINIGMKWGLTMIDPSQRDIFTKLRQAGKLPPETAGRPYDYVGSDAMKVIVVMSDGENQPRQEPRPGYDMGPSPIYRSPSDGYYSIRFSTGRPSSAGANQYYVPHLNSWVATPYGAGVQQDWSDIFARMRANYVGWQFYGRALGDNDPVAAQTEFTKIVSRFSMYPRRDDMNAQLQNLCDLAKAGDVIIYGISFEASQNGQEQLSKCASSPAHYFNAQGLEISTVFQTIASNISQLRLVQ
jgi:Flp pilus assembly protein TadG